MKLMNTKGYKEAYLVEIKSEENFLIRMLEENGFMWMDCDLPSDWIPSEEGMEIPYIIAIDEENDMWIFDQKEFDEFDNESGETDEIEPFFIDPNIKVFAPKIDENGKEYHEIY